MGKTNLINLTIRPMAADDVDAIYDIELDTFTDSWPRAAFVEWLGENWTANYVALEAGRIVGYLCAVGQDDELHIHNIAVTQPCRGRGIGRLLLTEAESWEYSPPCTYPPLTLKLARSRAVTPSPTVPPLIVTEEESKIPRSPLPPRDPPSTRQTPVGSPAAAS